MYEHREAPDGVGGGIVHGLFGAVTSRIPDKLLLTGRSQAVSIDSRHASTRESSSDGIPVEPAQNEASGDGLNETWGAVYVVGRSSELVFLTLVSWRRGNIASYDGLARAGSLSSLGA